MRINPPRMKQNQLVASTTQTVFRFVSYTQYIVAVRFVCVVAIEPIGF